MKKFYIATFGCRTNQADSMAIRHDFFSQRFEEVRHCIQADVVIVNSCTVTHRSDQQVRQLSRKLKRENPRALLIVTGCYAQRSPDALTCIPEIDAVVGNSHKDKIVQIATQSCNLPPTPPGRKEEPVVYRGEFSQLKVLNPIPAGGMQRRTRPFVKIQDGCDAKCSYCIIPFVRGPSRSVSPDLVIEQVRKLIVAKYKEVVLTGIHLGTYGMHLRPRYSLVQLLTDIISLPDLVQVRLSSIEPMQLSRQIIAMAAECGKIAPHFHICLQSGSDRILKKMLRPYSVAKFAGIVEEIFNKVPNAAIGTDVITGFPGETEEDHQQTLAFIEDMPFTYLHVFPYSDRAGTSASRMKGKIASKIQKRRSLQLRQLSEKKNEAFRQNFFGQRVSVLTLNEEKDGMREGITGNYLKVRVPAVLPGNEVVTGVVTGEDEEGRLLLRVVA